jgi:hypothetical protein
MATITFSVPVKLKKEMDKHKFINWSEVVTKAFRKKIAQLSKSKHKTLKKGESALVKQLAEASDRSNLYGTEEELLGKLRRK